VDAECGAGLLCDDGEHSCRPIRTIRLITSFEPTGRSESFSEGLDYAHGSLWQATPYALFRIDVAKRAVIATYPEPSPYGESLAWNGEVLYHVSLKNDNLYAARIEGGALPFSVVGRFENAGGCAFGIAAHCGELYTTHCGQSVVDVYDAGVTSPIKRSFTPTDLEGSPLPQVEDLAVYRRQLWASTFAAPKYGRTLFRIDVASGRAVAAYEIACMTIAIDGVAADPATRTLYVTGKNCPIFVYRVE
jgi:glutamine cyclotransferase